MKYITILFLLVLIAIPSWAQYAVPEGSPLPQEPRRRTSGAETAFYVGTAAMVSGFIIGAFTSQAENPSTAGVAAGTGLLFGGWATMTASLASMAFHNVPSYRIGYCSRWASEADTENYRRVASAGKAVGIGGLTLFTVGVAADLVGGMSPSLAGLQRASTPLWVSGLALTAAGVITFVAADNVYYMRAKRAWERQGRPTAYLGIGAQQHGLGAALCF